MQEQVIGKRRFVDGETRVVYRDGQGQYVLDDDLSPVYGSDEGGNRKLDRPTSERSRTIGPPCLAGSRYQ
jgi:hypothetical protein